MKKIICILGLSVMVSGCTTVDTINCSNNCSNIILKSEVLATKTKKRIVLDNVPYICQQDRLDCGFVCRAMLQAYFDKNFDNISYAKSMHDSAGCYGFAYKPNSLALLCAGYHGLLDEENEWLASLYGLLYERIVPCKFSDKEDAWNEYINKIWHYLQEGVPVQTCRSWPGTKEEGGKLYTSLGFRPFWWEGITKKYRPENHFIVVVGLDKSKGVIYVNDPAWGWLGMGKYEEMELQCFRSLVEALPPRLRYWTTVFIRSDVPTKEEDMIEEMLRQRIVKRLKGNPEVYDKSLAHCLHGLKGLEAFKNDLKPMKFGKILKAKMQRQGVLPVEALTNLNLALNQYLFRISAAAEYLEVTGKIEEWKWLSNLRILYEKLYILNGELLSIFKSSRNFEQALIKSKPVLKKMRRVADKMIQLYSKLSLNYATLIK